MDLLVQLHDVTVVCVVVVITVGAGTAAAKLRREANKRRRGSDNIFKKTIELGAANIYTNRRYMRVCTSLQKKE